MNIIVVIYCENHCSEYIKYCSTCQVNLCKLCENEHKKLKDVKNNNVIHNIKDYKQMEPNLDNIKESLSKINEKHKFFKIYC